MDYATFKTMSDRRTGKVAHEITRIGDKVFDSRAEADRYIELSAMQKGGIISDLVCQPRFEIIPKQKVDGHSFRAAYYTADFQYVRDGKVVVEDVKSVYTRQAEDYKLRRKLMLLHNGIFVEEVIR